MSKLKVRDLMTTQVVTLKPDDTVKKAVIIRVGQHLRRARGG